MFALIPYLLSLIIIRFRWYKTARIVQIAGIVLLCIINYLNSQVYAIYHFHINGFVLSMVFGEGAGEIFNFDIMLYLKEIALFVVVAAIVIGIWYASYLLWKLHRMHSLCSSLPYLWSLLSAAFRDEERNPATVLFPYLI